METFSYYCREIWKNRMVYTLLCAGLVWMLIFAYMPMGGLLLAFKDFKANLGIWKSPWIGFDYFKILFRDGVFWRSVWRTLGINISKLLISFPVPILLALFLCEIRIRKCRKILQIVYTFPHFLSWIIVSGIMINVLSINGLVNGLFRYMGIGSVNFLGSPALFVPVLYLSEIWKSSGWNAIIYMAAISGINQEQYEAAEIDGSSRLQSMFYITLPNIRQTMVVLFVLAAGNLMTSSFDQIFNLSNAATKNAAEVLDIYIYRITFQGATNFSFSAAASFFRSMANMILLLAVDRAAKMIGGSGIFGIQEKQHGKK
jgi:putative aldouronate transport system permease protein